MHKETELNIGAMAKEYCKAVVVLLVKFCNLRAYGKFVVLSLVFFFSPSFHGLRSSCCCVGCVPSAIDSDSLEPLSVLHLK